MEAGVLARISTRPRPPDPPTYSRRTVFVFVDDFDLATHRRAALRAQPAAHHAARGALRDRQRPGGDAAQGLGGREHRDTARLRGLRGPEAGPVRRGTGQRRGRAARRGGDRDPAPARLLAAARQAAARPHRRQDRRRGEPDPARGGHDRAVRRAQPAGDHPGAAGRGRPRSRHHTMPSRPQTAGPAARRPDPADKSPRPRQDPPAAKTPGPDAGRQRRDGRERRDEAADAAHMAGPDPRWPTRRAGGAGRRHRRRASTTGPPRRRGSGRSDRSPGPAGPRWRAGCTRSRSARSSATPCSPPRSPTRPAS